MYFQPSDIWDVYGVKSRNEYVEKFVIKGNFHKHVPDHIIKSYETAEYLMAHAYYHWPMYDEALKKILGIYEMAIKLKCQLLGIEIEVKANDNKTKKKDLAILIDQLISKKGYPNELKLKLQGIRELRNMLAHPSGHSFMGAMNIGAIIRTVNIINQLFLEENWYTLQQQEFNNIIRNNVLELKDGLFILTYNNQHILVYNPQPVTIMKVKTDLVHCWSFNRLIDDIKDLSYNKIPQPIIFFFKETKIKNGSLVAVDFNTNERLEIIKTVKPVNLEKYQNHIKAFSSLKEKDKRVFEMMQSDNAGKLIQEFTHKNCWNK